MAVAFGQLCLATVLFWSGLLKLRDVSAFRRHVATTLPRLGAAFRQPWPSRFPPSRWPPRDFC